MLLGREVRDAESRQLAISKYAELVADGHGVKLWDESLRQQIFLGDEAFVNRMLSVADPKRLLSREVPVVQRSGPWSLAQWLVASSSRDVALLRAHVDSGMSVSAIARELKLSVSRVSRVIKAQRLRTMADEATGKT